MSTASPAGPAASADDDASVLRTTRLPDPCFAREAAATESPRSRNMKTTEPHATRRPPIGMTGRRRVRVMAVVWKTGRRTTHLPMQRPVGRTMHHCRSPTRRAVRDPSQHRDIGAASMSSTDATPGQTHAFPTVADHGPRWVPASAVRRMGHLYLAKDRAAWGMPAV